MNKNSGFKKKGKSGGSSQSTRKPKSDVEIGDDPVLQMFNEISIYLDSRHDKKERIVKLREVEKLEFSRFGLYQQPTTGIYSAYFFYLFPN